MKALAIYRPFYSCPNCFIKTQQPWSSSLALKNCQKNHFWCCSSAFSIKFYYSQHYYPHLTFTTSVSWLAIPHNIFKYYYVWDLISWDWYIDYFDSMIISGNWRWKICTGHLCSLWYLASFLAQNLTIIFSHFLMDYPEWIFFICLLKR